MFGNEAVGKIQRIVADCALEMDVNRWGALYAKGLGNFVAHTITMENEMALAAQAGGLATFDETTKTVGDTSVSRDGQQVRESVDEPLKLTYWGREYLRLRRRVGKGPVVL